MKKILVIDDEQAIGEIVQDFLEGTGYRTLIATDAREGLELLDREKPDLVMLDIVMPEMSGLECLKRIKAVSPGTIVIMVSGLQDERLAKQALDQGAYDYITKPFEMAHFVNHFLSRLFPA